MFPKTIDQKRVDMAQWLAHQAEVFGFSSTKN